MAVDYSQLASTDPNTVALGDPALQNDPTLASLASQTVGATGTPSPDLSQSTVDFNNLGLSGASYVPPDQAAGAATTASTDPLADPSLTTDLGQAGAQPPVQGSSASGQFLMINGQRISFVPPGQQQPAQPQQFGGLVNQIPTPSSGSLNINGQQFSLVHPNDFPG